MLCEKAEALLKATKRSLSNEDLFFALALSFSDCDYSVIEMSEEYYNHIKDCIIPFAIVLAIKDDLMVKENDKFEYPKENTIFCENGEYIEQIKEKLKKR